MLSSQVSNYLLIEYLNRKTASLAIREFQNYFFEFICDPILLKMQISNSAIEHFIHNGLASKLCLENFYITLPKHLATISNLSKVFQVL